MSAIASGLFTATSKPWWEPREAALNWLALGLLLAAWNAADNDAPSRRAERPAALRRHVCISVRAVQRTTEIRCIDAG